MLIIYVDKVYIHDALIEDYLGNTKISTTNTYISDDYKRQCFSA